LGMQTFEKIIEGNYVYIDKTDLIYKLVQYPSVFVSRPRRFGKSLLCSTLKSYFEGRKDLFKGLAIEKLETDWTEYPVIHLSLAANKEENIDSVNNLIDRRLKEYEEQYGITEPASKSSERMENIVNAAFKQTGRKVVIILDEYDAQMLNVIDNDELQAQARMSMNNLFSPLKDLDPKLRFIFITGITKFSQMSIFSALNNLTDISQEAEYEALCGISKDEITSVLKPDLEQFAKANEITYEKALQQFKERYDGYHFSESRQDIFNPYSVLRALDSKVLRNYWFDTGTPSSLIKLINKFEIQMPTLNNIRCRAEYFCRPVEKVTDLVPFLYQSGYITIKNYNKQRETYTLGFPNKEVRMAFADSLLEYAFHRDADVNSYMMDAYNDLKFDGNIASFMKYLNLFFRKFPFSLNNMNEKHYHAILFAVLASYGADVVANPESAKGRADLLLKFEDVNYIFELKYDGSTRAALDQVDDKDYIAVAMEPGKRIVKLAINFSSTDRSILDWDVDDGYEF